MLVADGNELNKWKTYNQQKLQRNKHDQNHNYLNKENTII
jgi:hypothetical protein